MDDVITIKIYQNRIIKEAQLVANRFEIPFDGIVYAGVVASTKSHDIPVSQVLDLNTEVKYVRLSGYTYNRLCKFAKRIDELVGVERSISVLLKFMLEHEDLIAPYYREVIDTTKATKISKSNK